MADEKQTEAIVKVKEEVRLTNWRSEYDEMRQSGMTVKEWCAQRGISQSGFYHRLRMRIVIFVNDVGVGEQDKFIFKKT